jgi:hypothetical protein
MTRRPIQPDILAIWAVLFVAAVLFWVVAFSLIVPEDGTGGIYVMEGGLS